MIAVDSRHSQPLERLHKQLFDCRTAAHQAEDTLRLKFPGSNLAFKVGPRMGAIVHVQTKKDVVALIAEDTRLVSLAGSGSTRSYSFAVSRITVALHFWAKVLMSLSVSAVVDAAS